MITRFPRGTLTRLAVLPAIGCALMSVHAAAPVNDSFSAPTVIAGATVSTTGSNAGATLESGEPNHGAASGKTGGRSVWWKWTAPTGGYLTVSVGGNFTHLVAVYTGASVTDLALVGSAWNGGGYNANARFDVVAGTEYHIAVDGQSGTSGNITMALSLQPPPANDGFAGRIVLSGASATNIGTNTGASKELGEPNHAGVAGGHSVWWTWTAPAGGRVTISADCSYFDKLLAVYTGAAVSELAPVASVAGDDSTVSVSFDAAAGIAYQIAVDGNDDFTDYIAVTVTLLPPPANDDFATRAVLNGINVEISNLSNLSATREPGEPAHAGDPGGRSVWWTWTATNSGHFVIVATGPFDKLLGVYTGISVSTLMEVARGAGASNVIARASFEAVSGTTYAIAVDGEGGASDQFELSLNFPPGNDDFANRSVITGMNISITATNVGATMEPGEPEHADEEGGASLWWSWTAPESGRVVAMVNGSFYSLLGIYSGDEVDLLTVVTSGAGSSSYPAYAAFDAVAGAVYQIAVDGEYRSQNAFTLKLQYVAGPPNDNFADRLALTNTSESVYYVTGSTLGAATETGEPQNGSASVWWTWTAPANGEVLLELETSLSGMNWPCLTLYRGDIVSGLTKVYPRADFTGSTYHDGRFVVAAGTNYVIGVTRRSGTPSNYTLRATFEPPPLNDAFANRFTITNTPFLFQYGYVYINGYNVCATNEPGEPRHGGASYSYVGKSVWWTWTAPVNGKASVGVQPLRYVFSSMVGVYTGEVVSTLTRVANAYSTCTDGSSAVNFPITAGTTYQIAADGGGPYGNSGEIRLSLDIDIDTNAPALVISSPANGQSVSAPSIMVSGTAADPVGTGGYVHYSSGVKLVELRVNEGPWQSATGTNTWSRSLDLVSATNLIEARCRDVAGNESSLTSVTVTFGTRMSAQVSGSDFAVSFPTESGKTYQLQCAPSLTPPIDWAPVNPTPENGNDSPMTLTDTNGVLQPQRFYRLLVQ